MSVNNSVCQLESCAGSCHMLTPNGYCVYKKDTDFNLILWLTTQV